jgi:hypothetical protein
MNDQLLEELTNTVYSFGSPFKGPFGYLTFQKDGSVIGYQNKNEASWKLKNEKVFFYDKSGNKTSVLTYNKQLHSWFGRTLERKTPLYLHRLFTLKNIVKKNSNNIPTLLLYGTVCNGSKFIETYINKCGWQTSNVNILNISSINDLNYNPPKYVECPILPLVSLLNGQTVIGSFEDIKTLNDICENGVKVLTVTRNVKHVILELFEHYLETHANNTKITAANKIKLAEKFIAKYEKTLFSQIRGILRNIINDNEKIILRYEDFIDGKIPKDVYDVLNVWSPNTSKTLSLCMQDLDTSDTVALTTEWIAPFEKIYRSTGLASYNHILGYLD